MAVRLILMLACLMLSGASLVQSASQTINPGDNLGSALGQLKPGDTLTLNAGTYNCSGCFDGMPGGTSSARVTVAAAPGATVTIKVSGGGNGINFTSQKRSYITFERLRLDMSGVGAAGLKITCDGSGDYSHHIRLVKVELFGAKTQGVLANAGQCNASNQGANEFLDSVFRNNGSDPQFDHALYLASSDNVIDRSVIKDNSGCGVHIYSSSGPPSASRNIVRNNKASGHNGQCGVGILMGSGSDNQAYNNLVTNNNYGLMIGNGGNNNQAYNNTIANNRQWCLRDDNSGTQLHNNICSGNGNNGVTGDGGATTSNNLMGDAKFVNAGAGDYHLASGSPAIKAGLDLSRMFTMDLDGLTRPSGKFDLGAYSVGGTGGGSGGGGGTVSLPAPTNLRLVTAPSP